MLNRYVCSALSELRDYLTQHERKYEVAGRDMGHILGLVEEIQTYVNRMEAGLGDNHDLHRLQDEVSRLKKQRDELQEGLGDAARKDAMEELFGD